MKIIIEIEIIIEIKIIIKIFINNINFIFIQNLIKILHKIINIKLRT